MSLAGAAFASKLAEKASTDTLIAAPAAIKPALVATPKWCRTKAASQPLHNAPYPTGEFRPAQTALLARTQLVT
jgi:hypothetical protein